MSNYWRLHCKTCEVSSETDINHGEEILRDFVRCAPACKTILEAKSGYLEVHAMGYGTELASFVVEHIGHEIDLNDEYGRFEPVELPEKPRGGNITIEAAPGSLFCS